ncbi:MAG TPA: hypothetical protein VHB51_04290 [Candidatus Saccharimonadales bacterium]|nr:hypothetical protein [Candidatus Saccharimonadales bacterium]
MSEGLRFGHEATEFHDRLYIDIDPSVSKSFFGDETAATRALSFISAKRLRAVDLAPAPDLSDRIRMYLNAKKIGSIANVFRRNLVLGHLGTVINGLQDHGSDPNVWVQWAVTPDDYGHYNASFGFNWPIGVSDETLSAVVASSVDDATGKIGYMHPDGSIEKSTGAAVNRERGVFLWLGDGRVTNLGTDYDPKDRWVEMKGRNLTDPRQQFIAVGAVAAAAYPDDLVANQ